MARVSAIGDVLAEVGPRVKRVQTRPDVTRTALATATGISKSTLSRLESGQRRPSLELLLPIAQAHRIPLDGLVGAPEIRDPRIGPAGDRPVEILSILGREGERIHIRAAPPRKTGDR